MAMISCPNCGHPVSSKAYNCPRCTNTINSRPVILYTTVIPGRGLAISSMIMGIFAVAYGVLAFAMAYFDKDNLIRSLGAFITIPTVFTILTVSFGCGAQFKKYKGGMGISGLVMGTITFLLIVVTIMMIIPTK